MKPGNSLKLGSVTTASGPADLILSPRQRSEHVYVPGSTGSGKSKFLERLIRQDVNAWCRTRCGVLLLDWHGSLYDDVVAYLAEGRDPRLPVVLVDPSRPEDSIRYDPLRRREVGEPDVLMDDLVAAVLHSWGQADPHATPRLSKWLRTIFMTLYENGLPLTAAMELLSDATLRARLAARVTDPSARATWAAAASMKPAEFVEHTESVASRLLPFVSSRAMRRMLGSSGPSLDLGRALDGGSIVLVSLSRERGRLSAQTAKTLGSLILSDLWSAASVRGKGDGVRPFYVYLDEFQNFVNPVMGESLDQARGFGLHLTMAHQYPSQLLHHGPAGQPVYDSALANAKTMVLFQLKHPKDVVDLATMAFRGTIDPDAVKYQGYGTETVGHELVWLTGSTVGWNEADIDTRTDSTSTTATEGTTEGESDSEGIGLRGSIEDADGSAGDPDRAYVTRTKGRNAAKTSSVGTTEGTAVGRARQTGRSGGETTSGQFRPILRRVKLPPIFKSVDEQIFMATQFVAAQPARHCVVSVTGSRVPLHLVTPEVHPPRVTKERAIRYAASLVRALPFAVGPALPAPAAPTEPDGGECVTSRKPARKAVHRDPR